MTNLDRAMIEFGRQIDREMEDFAAWARAPADEPTRTTWADVALGIALVAVAVALAFFYR